MAGHPLALDEAAQDLLFREARTANTFAPTQIGDEHIEAIYDLVKWGPTSMNQQPMRVLLVRSDESRQALLHHVLEGNRDKVASAPLVAVLAADLSFPDTLPRLFPHAPNARHAYADEHARRESAVFNTALQLGYFIIGIRAGGLAAGPIAGFDPEGVHKEFFPGEPVLVTSIVNIGHPGPDAFSARLPRLGYREVVRSV
ncbi:malonic semialdehyde reductase [Streptomyces sp. NPDC007164]|uniref:malonic semialdehyde reductase n=1 Tax=Streptomyces sp. NPDC007164 TaxID=3156918 RepID=UPI0033F134BE